ncbi:MAG TPA: hypothetical protein DIC60_08805 [Lachnospiraceae bacterium]|nr:hypothetical protein [Lachnospiraceae bacterium]
MKKFDFDLFLIKITSRKFWVALAGLATAIMTFMNCDNNAVVQVTSIITALGSVVGYLLANGLTDDSVTTTDTTTKEKDKSE